MQRASDASLYSGKKLAIIGASYLQLPLIRRARELGLETHVFAWQVGDVGESEADFFYPISITEYEKIEAVCRAIGIDGICSIASDLAAITVNYVAGCLGLIGNTWFDTKKMTNKFAMRCAFAAGGDPSPKSYLVDEGADIDSFDLALPAIVKPTDRSGSRGVTYISSRSEIGPAIQDALSQSFERKAVLEEYVIGTEYSAECICFAGRRQVLAVTRKFTTGIPNFIETAHLEPSCLLPQNEALLRKTVLHALATLGIDNGAAHAEVIMDANNCPHIVEIGGRMGGDCIGSHLVQLTTGIDYVRAVIDVSLGIDPAVDSTCTGNAAAVRFFFGEDDLRAFYEVQNDERVDIVEFELPSDSLFSKASVHDSSERAGYFVMTAARPEDLEAYLPC